MIRLVKLILIVFLLGGGATYVGYSLPQWLFRCEFEDLVLSNPKGSGEKFTVLIARLENDPDREKTRWLSQGFRSLAEISTVQTCKRLRVRDVEVDRAQGLDWLEKHRADLLAYGESGDRGGRVFFMSEGPELTVDRDAIYFLEDEIGVADFQESESVVVVGLIRGFFEFPRWRWDLSRLLSELETASLTPEVSGLLNTLLGQRDRSRERLERAVLAYDAALALNADDLRVRNNRGLALLALSDYAVDEREIWIARAIEEHRHVSQGYFQAKELTEWRLSELNLARALTALGRYQRDSASLQEALAIYRTLLNSFNRRQEPELWSLIHRQYSYGLESQGELDTERRGDWFRESLEMARVAVEEVLPREERILGHHRLAQALDRVADTVSNPVDFLEEAVRVYRLLDLEDSWSSFTRFLPYYRGRALSRLGLASGEEGYFQQALEAYQLVISEYSQDSTEWAQAQIGWIISLRDWGRMVKDSMILDQALDRINRLEPVFLEFHPPQANRFLQRRKDEIQEVLFSLE